MRTLLILPVTLAALLVTPIVAVYLAKGVKWAKVGLWLFVDVD